ncbi:phosphatidate cytidylyltransferase [Neisseriaceae bacterium ESL0693]|nr:phosphatidate cytidylyltransferase [Neisseriaceae bacterium ESL0693]
MALIRIKPQQNWRELTLRIKTWWLIVIFFSCAIISPHWLGLTLFAFVSFMALKEFLTLIPMRQTDRMPILWLFLTIPINYCLIGYGQYNLFIIFIPIYVFLFLPIRMVLSGDTRNFLNTVSKFHWALMTTVFAFSHVAFLLVLPSHHESGALLALFLVGLTEVNDITQYLWGKSLGKIKITPTVSPNKTLAGFLGGVISTVLLALIIGPILTPLTFGMAFISGLIISIAGFCGDIVMSAIKRDIGIKDSGTLLPGHGGILDRLDSLIFTAPLFFHFMHYFYY